MTTNIKNVCVRSVFDMVATRMNDEVGTCTGYSDRMVCLTKRDLWKFALEFKLFDKSDVPSMLDRDDMEAEWARLVEKDIAYNYPDWKMPG